MLDFRPILYVIGLFLGLLGLAMLVPAFVDAAVGHPDWVVFAAAAATTLFVGVSLILATRSRDDALDLRQAFVLTAGVWVIMPVFAALPFFYAGLSLDFTDAYFEAVSGITTTGSTIMTSLDTAPPGILLWRGILQWLGGIGIVVMAVAVLPMLGIGGMQFFRTESFDTTAGIIPRAREVSGTLSRMYLMLTMLVIVALLLVGLKPLDAVVHAMTSIATGGFSTRDASIGAFESRAVETILTFAMVVGSLPFLLIAQALRGRTGSLFRDSQVQAFFGLLVFVIGTVTVWLILFKEFSLGPAIRYASFNVVSLLTGTGYASTDYGNWGAFSISVFFMIMFIGGCTGSTSCAIKVFRLQVLLSSIWAQIKSVLQPNGVFHTRFGGRRLPPTITSSVVSYLFLFLLSFVFLAAALAATGLDPVTALSGAGTSLANVGPGLGAIIGPAGNFASLPDTAKWLMSFGMILGRLEFFAVLVLITPGFWRA